MRFLGVIAVLGILAVASPVSADQGQLKVNRSTDSNGNSVIVIHETRPEVLSRQRTQIQRAQFERQSKKERELRLEIERLRAERELVEAETRREAARRAYATAPRMVYGQTQAYSQPRARASFFNGGLGPLGGASFGFWGGGYGGGFYPGSGFCAPRWTPVCR